MYSLIQNLLEMKKTMFVVLKTSLSLIVLFLISHIASAQNDRTQYPGFLSNSYFSVNVGYINYPFTNQHMEPGFHVSSIHVPHAAARVVLFGHQFNRYLSAQVSYMRPVKYAEFTDVNNDHATHHVWMHFGSLTLRPQLPLNNSFSLFGEAGLAIVSRKGFNLKIETAVKSTSYGSFLYGGGLQYKLNNKLDVSAGISYMPSNQKENQPYTIYYSAGFRYTMRPLPEEVVKRNAQFGYIFPANLLQLGYAVNTFGYEVNNFVSKKVPIFWGGSVEIKQGLALRYHRNVFHTRKVFALDIGTSLSWWQTRKEKESFYALSVFPVFRFNVIRSSAVDLYLNYSVAGPSYISKLKLDSLETGRHFTFQDFMGIGIYTGKKRNVNAEISINHYSNGNIFTENAGVKIPLTFTMGYAF